MNEPINHEDISTSETINITSIRTIQNITTNRTISDGAAGEWTSILRFAIFNSPHLLIGLLLSLLLVSVLINLIRVLFWMLGFGRKGPRFGSKAARWQPAEVKSGSYFARSQTVNMHTTPLSSIWKEYKTTIIILVLLGTAGFTVLSYRYSVRFIRTLISN